MLLRFIFDFDLLEQVLDKYLVSVCGSERHDFKPVWKMFNDSHVVVINIKCWSVVIQVFNLDDNLKQKEIKTELVWSKGKIFNYFVKINSKILTLAIVDLRGLSFCLASIWRLKRSPLVIGKASRSISFVTYNFPVVGSIEK